MPDTVVSDALRFPQDEGLSASIADGHESWPSAGYLAGLANAVGEQPFVDHGLTFTNHDGSNDEVDVASGRAYVHVDTVDVQSGLGGSAPPSYDRQLSGPVPLMLELPTGAANLSVSSGTANPVWLAYALDSIVDGVEAGDIYLRHGSGETAPPHPSVKLGETNPDSPGSDTRASDGPVLDARSATIDEATIQRLAAAIDANGQDITGAGTVGADLIDTEDLGSDNPPIRSGHANMADIGIDSRSEVQSKTGKYTKPTFMLHFDDGLSSHYEKRDFFADRNVKPGFAVRPGEMGDTNRLTWDQTRELQDEYDYEINSHGHGDWGRFDTSTDEEIEKEVVEAQRLFAENRVFARHYVYANGATGGVVGKGVVSDYYGAGWGTGGDIIDYDTRYGLPRESMDGTDRTTLENAIDNAISSETGLVLYGHEIIETEANEDGNSVSTEKLQHLIDYVRNNGGEWATNSKELLRHSNSTWRISNEDGGSFEHSNGRPRIVTSDGDQAIVTDNDGDALHRWFDDGGFDVEVRDSSYFRLNGNYLFYLFDGGEAIAMQHDNGTNRLRGAGDFEMHGGGPAPQPTNLSGVTGNRDGEIRVDDGTNTTIRGTACVWDDTNNVWRPVNDPDTGSFT
ncbi:hypothetical protein HZS55_09150 [Halosimplex rubrum]|uniref:Polysaccharide deacetylase family protein n=1 Tax=Halosimplex rubrum TaxID=869889 RepID=A0A7D5SXQ8_9EURY|nr:hypothetical protein [Halosimplex rubrum]QLH77451.1 hypothetical protein HZS55_09150 [Halosimplex rubrum]